MAKQKKKKTELSKGMVKKPSINVQKLNPTQIKSVSNAKLLSSAKTSKVLREVKSRVKAGKIKLPKGFDIKREGIGDLMNHSQMKSISNANLLSSAKTPKVLQEVKRRVKAGKIKLPKGFDTKRGKVSDLMNQLTVRKKAGR